MAAWITYRGLDFFRPAGSAYVYTTAQMEIDADGAPQAYHPADTGLDALANAGFPGGGWRSVLVADPNDASKPFVQPDGPTAGFFVSMTALQDGFSPASDPKKYVDATKVPYLVFPGGFHRLAGTGDMGDLLMAKNLHNGNVSAAIVADIGPADAELGEVSIKLVEALGGTNPNPRNGAGKPPGPFRYVVFPRSRRVPRWPLMPDQIQQIAQDLLEAAGGWDAFDSLA